MTTTIKLVAERLFLRTGNVSQWTSYQRCRRSVLQFFSFGVVRCVNLFSELLGYYGDNVSEDEMSVTQGIHKRMVRFKKLTRNLFLSLHGHNVHGQYRQLSKFLMRYQQFASHAYCGAAGPVSKMASQQKNASCVLRFECPDL